jgi:hypothetical protein
VQDVDLRLCLRQADAGPKARDRGDDELSGRRRLVEAVGLDDEPGNALGKLG